MACIATTIWIIPCCLLWKRSKILFLAVWINPIYGMSIRKRNTMNPNKPRASAAIFEVLKGKVIFCLRYWPFYVIVVTLLVFVACYSPSQRMVDNYSQLSDQHSPVLALKSYPLIALCSLLPWFQATAVKLVFLLFIIYGFY